MGCSPSALRISTGTNEITITGTDPAGNTKELLPHRPARFGRR